MVGSCRLEEVMYDNKRLFLVFEYLELDLKKYMDTTPALAQNKHLIKVKGSSGVILH